MTAFFRPNIIAAILAVVPTPLLAQQADEGTIVSGERPDLQTKYVYYNDLNLASGAGVERLESRVRSAARSICLSNGLRPLDVLMSERKCFKDAVDGAEPQIAAAVRRSSGSLIAAGATAVVVKRRAS